jgi:hypothetical protein
MQTAHKITEAKAFTTFTFNVFEYERLSTSIKLTLHKALIRSVKTYACPAWELVTNTYLIKLHTWFSAYWKFSKVDTGPRFVHGFQPSICI